MVASQMIPGNMIVALFLPFPILLSVLVSIIFSIPSLPTKSQHARFCPVLLTSTRLSITCSSCLLYSLSKGLKGVHSGHMKMHWHRAFWESASKNQGFLLRGSLYMEFYYSSAYTRKTCFRKLQADDLLGL